MVAVLLDIESRERKDNACPFGRKLHIVYRLESQQVFLFDRPHGEKNRAKNFGFLAREFGGVDLENRLVGGPTRQQLTHLGPFA